jgi:hypothetical protein
VGLREDASENNVNKPIVNGERLGLKRPVVFNKSEKRNHKNLKQIIILSFDAIKERKLRSTLTILMVVAGCALMVALNALSAGNTAFISKQLDMLAPNIMLLVLASMDFTALLDHRP